MWLKQITILDWETVHQKNLRNYCYYSVHDKDEQSQSLNTIRVKIAQTNNHYFYRKLRTIDPRQCLYSSGGHTHPDTFKSILIADTRHHQRTYPPPQTPAMLVITHPNLVALINFQIPSLSLLFFLLPLQIQILSYCDFDQEQKRCIW